MPKVNALHVLEELIILFPNKKIVNFVLQTFIKTKLELLVFYLFIYFHLPVCSPCPETDYSFVGSVTCTARPSCTTNDYSVVYTDCRFI